VADIGAVYETAHKPRVLPIISPPAFALPDEPETSIALAPPAGKIPPLQFARIRLWVKYGKTVAQAAPVCGVTVAEIQRILPYVTGDESLPILGLG
jgi:hypothetical protein